MATNKTNSTQRDSSIKQLLKFIYKAIDEKLNSCDTICSGVVDSVNSDGSVNVHLPPDPTTFTKIPNQSPFPLFPNDCVKLIKEKGKTSNMWIIGKCGAKNFVNQLYRVGDLKLTTENMNPEKYLGGKWEMVGDHITIGTQIENVFVWKRVQ